MVEAHSRDPALKPIFRYAARSDADQLGALLTATVPLAGSALVTLDELALRPARLAARMVASTEHYDQLIVVAVVGDVIAGAARVLAKEFVCAAHVGTCTLLVHPQFRELGIGADLLRLTEQAARTELDLERLEMRVCEGDRGLATVCERLSWRVERVEPGAVMRADTPLALITYATDLAPAEAG